MARSPHAFARAQVIVLLHDEQNLPMAAALEDGAVLALAFTDVDDARARLTPGAPFTLKSVPVHELIQRIPDAWGIVVDPDRPYPQVVDPSEKPAVLAASDIFPDGYEVTLAPATRKDRALTAALRDLAPDAGAVRAWLVRHSVDGLPFDLVVAVSAESQADVLRFADAVYEAAKSLSIPESVWTAWMDELPVDHAMWIRTQRPIIEPSLSRP